MLSLGFNSSGATLAQRLRWSRGEVDAATPDVFLDWLQWGRGESLHFANARAAREASMGPRLLSRGESPTMLSDSGSTSGFNGAAARKPRRGFEVIAAQVLPRSGNGSAASQLQRVETVPHARRHPIASMGPRLLSRGEFGTHDLHHGEGVASMRPRLLSCGERWSPRE